MTSIRSFALLCSLIIVSPACATIKLWNGATLSSEAELGLLFQARNGYGQFPQPDPADFQPPSQSMSAEDGADIDLQVGGRLSLRQQLPDSIWFVGVQSDYYALSNSGSYAQLLGTQLVNWWDQVVGAQAIIKRSPSIGGCLGMVIDRNSRGTGALLKYGLFISHYDLMVDSYRGVDVYGGRNYSVVKTTAHVSSGMAIRHELEFGSEYFARILLWLETDGPKQMTTGLTLVVTLPAWATISGQ